jgi:hypothetical protein
MRFEIAVHAQGGRMRSDLSQQTALDEKPEIVVDRSERNGWNAAPDRGINVFRGIVPVGSDDSLVYHLTLVRNRQSVLRSQFTELLMSVAHNYRMRMIIKLPKAVSIEIFAVTSKKAGVGNAAELKRRTHLQPTVCPSNVYPNTYLSQRGLPLLLTMALPLACIGSLTPRNCGVLPRGGTVNLG